MHARLAAKNDRIDSLPILITPHPLNDLSAEHLEEMARAALPVIVEHLTGQGELARDTPIDFVHPAVRENRFCIDPNLKRADA